MTRPRVLVLCTGNSARSQMGEALLRSLSGGRLEVFSAGTHPVGVNPFAIQAMKELGTDISSHRSKSVEEFAGQSFDAVITVCDRAAGNCPIFSGPAERIHFSFEDPAAVTGDDETKLRAFRRVRDEIAQAFRNLLATRPSWFAASSPAP